MSLPISRDIEHTELETHSIRPYEARRTMEQRRLDPCGSYGFDGYQAAIAAGLAERRGLARVCGVPALVRRLLAAL